MFFNLVICWSNKNKKPYFQYSKMQIFGIYVLYRNNQIYLELNCCTIIYGEFFCVFFLIFRPLMQVQTLYLLKNSGRVGQVTVL